MTTFRVCVGTLVCKNVHVYICGCIYIWFVGNSSGLEESGGLLINRQFLPLFHLSFALYWISRMTSWAFTTSLNTWVRRACRCTPELRHSESRGGILHSLLHGVKSSHLISLLSCRGRRFHVFGAKDRSGWEEYVFLWQLEMNDRKYVGFILAIEIIERARAR